jgi:GTP diphosphokinase / guanosine-3',5'-bis(diphosphate) 3'-diphosphatase
MLADGESGEPPGNIIGNTIQPPDRFDHISADAEALKQLISGYLKPADVAKVEAAFAVANAAHEGQTRKSGEPYITHPLAVATILAQWHLDAQALIAAILHDVVEDTPTTKADIAKQFGKAVAELVDGVSKLDKLQFATLEEAQAENFRKMLLAMARDVRVILIKLADRLHNMRIKPSKNVWLKKHWKFIRPSPIGLV